VKDKKAMQSPCPLVFLAVFISLLEGVLILSGVIPPVLFYSPANIIFSLAGLAVVAYTGIIYAKEGIFTASKYGALVSFASALAFCLSELFSHLFLNAPVLGIRLPDIPSLLFMLAIIVVENTLLGGIIAGLAAWVKRRIHPY